jgi:thiol-disulfide isomerase/thioredoxin
MMKSITKNIGIFLALTLVISSIGGCSDTASSRSTDQANNSNAPSNGNSAPAKDPEQAKKNPNYRPIEKSVDEAQLKNLDGSTFRVADKRGKVVLLNMWATWCGPCRAEMPTLVKMQDQHRDAGLEIIGLNTDEESVDDINRFAQARKLNYTLVWADTELQSSLLKISKFGGIPQSFIIDREGNLRGVFRGANPADIKKMDELVELIVNE